MQRRKFIRIGLVGLCGLLGVKPISGDILRQTTTPDDVWTHVAYECNSRTFYVNGVKYENLKDIPPYIQKWVKDYRKDRWHSIWYKSFKK